MALHVVSGAMGHLRYTTIFVSWIIIRIKNNRPQTGYWLGAIIEQDWIVIVRILIYILTRSIRIVHIRFLKIYITISITIEKNERGRIFDRNFYSGINERVSKVCWWWRLMLKAIVQFLLLRHFQELFNFIIFVKSFVTFFCQILNNTRTFIFLCGILFMQHFISTFIIKKW